MLSILKSARLVCVVALLACAGSVFSATTVVASIKPLQLLAAAITDGISVPKVVLAPGQDPHHMALRPSDRQALNDAGLVLWVGPALELPLGKVIAQSKGRVITAQSLASMVVAGSGSAIDPHLWLDSRNARVIAKAVTDSLSQLDAANAVRYNTNMQKLLASLDAADAELAREFAAVKSVPWAVSHQAFRYVVQQRQLQEPIALTDSNNTSASVQRVLDLRKRMDEKKVSCLISEPSDNRQQLDALIENKRVTIAFADTLGSSIDVAADGYPSMLRDVSKVIYNCMGGRHE